MPTLKLCDFPAYTGHARWPSFSPFVVLVERALRLAKLPFQHDRISMLKVRSLSPTGQLPVLLIDDEALPDSTRILHRIDETLAPGSLTRGLDARAAAEAWLWEEFADTALYPQGARNALGRRARLAGAAQSILWRHATGRADRRGQLGS